MCFINKNHKIVIFKYSCRNKKFCFEFAMKLLQWMLSGDTVVRSVKLTRDLGQYYFILLYTYVWLKLERNILICLICLNRGWPEFSGFLQVYVIGSWNRCCIFVLYFSSGNCISNEIHFLSLYKLRIEHKAFTSSTSCESSSCECGQKRSPF